MTDEERAALRAYPDSWDIHRRESFVAGARWMRGQVFGQGAPPADVMLRREQAVREAYPPGRHRG